MPLYVQNNATSVVHDTGRMVMQGVTPDYDPTVNRTNTQVVLQLDGGQGVSENTARAGSERRVSWTTRRGVASTTLTSEVNDPVALQSQDGRCTVAFARTGAGLSGTWGPFTSAAFTLAVVVRLDGTVTDYGTVPGLGGTLPLLVSPHLTVSIPVGGGGLIPLDAMFLDRWRILIVRNDAVAQRVYIDKQLVLTASPTTGTVGANDAVGIGAAFPGEIAELVVWDGALDSSDTDAFAEMLGEKWNTAALPSVPRIVIPNNGIGDVWPPDVPTPTVWLDAAHPASLFADAAATVPTVGHGRVAHWSDRSGNGHHVAFNPTGKTYWAIGGAEQINGLPGVSVSGDDPGTFTGGNPLNGALAGAFAVVAVWRLTGSGGHPFCINGHGTFTSTEWVDALGTNSYHTMPAPNTLAPFSIGPRDVVMMAWERTAAGVLQLRVYNLSDVDASGTKFTESANTDSAWLSKVVTIGSSTKGLQLSELMVWSGALPDNAARASLRAHLVRRWGNAILPSVGAGLITNVLPAAVVIPTGQMVRYLRLTRTVGNDYMNEAGLEAYQGSHTTICSITRSM